MFVFTLFVIVSNWLLIFLNNSVWLNLLDSLTNFNISIFKLLYSSFKYSFSFSVSLVLFLLFKVYINNETITNIKNIITPIYKYSISSPILHLLNNKCFQQLYFYH